MRDWALLRPRAWREIALGDQGGPMNGLGAVASVGVAATLVAGVESVAGGGAVGAALEHAAQSPRSIAMAESLLIAPLFASGS